VVGAFLSLIVMVASAPELNDQTYSNWRDYIRPSAQEQGFLEIPWRESFFTAVKEAKEKDRPILLWAMNGHPLGCT
jgi:hypothetical protein